MLRLAPLAHLPAADALVVEFSGARLEGGLLDGDWLRFAPDAALLRPGDNELAITLQQAAEPAPVVRDLRLDVNYP